MLINWIKIEISFKCYKFIAFENYSKYHHYSPWSDEYFHIIKDYIFSYPIRMSIESYRVTKVSFERVWDLLMEIIINCDKNANEKATSLRIYQLFF